jgi:dTDP-4-dehydrorhamnose 3,5-epimerase
MPYEEMSVPGAWIHSPIRHVDNRGHFEEQFKLSEIEAVLGREFTVRQTNKSLSRKGVVRGIHFSDSPQGQLKYVSCSKGAIWDVVVDLRLGSQTYGSWDATELSPDNGKTVLITEGLGHSFLSLQDDSVVTYLCNEEYDPRYDQSVNPFSPDLRIPYSEIGFKFGITKLETSEKDAKATFFKLNQST